MTAAGGAGRDAVAIIGMAGRFPGAWTVEEFWRNLRDGVESVVPFTDEQLLAAGVPPEVSQRPGYVRKGPWFDGMDLFDAGFFGYTPREAEVMDPQHRVFLETAWEALEDAGYDAARHDGDVGVFGGAGANQYVARIHANRPLTKSLGRSQVLVGNEVGFLTPRVSYKLDLTGPSQSLRTACSTGLVALHTACRSLADRECDAALVGSVFIDPAQGSGYQYVDGGFLSPDGHCRPFDAEARGTVFGSGVAVLVVKRLADAIADGDTVRAVIRGSAVNNDGAVKVGFTAPSVTGQAAVIASALERAGLAPGDIDYVEAHGTGTSLGDPIEVQALSKVFAGLPAGSVGLGSLKGNVGHLDAAAGIAGVVKSVLALENELLPASLNFDRPNADMDTGGPFRVVKESRKWPRSGRVRRAGVSAFGFGGTNAHVVLEEAPAAHAPAGSPRGGELLVVSARTEAELDRASERLAGFLREKRPCLADAAYTLAAGRGAFPFRRAAWGADAAGIADALERGSGAGSASGGAPAEPADVLFVFSGQGPQYPGMGRELYEREPVYRAAVDACAAVADDLMGGDLRALLCGEDTGGLLTRTRWTQPALFTVEYALVRLWESWGMTPSAMLGHSLGELTAACVSGVFSLEDALALVVLRGRLMQECGSGAMCSVRAGRDDVVASLPAALSLAAHNGPNECLVSGPAAAVREYADLAAGWGWSTQVLPGSQAFHSALMEPAVEEFVRAVGEVERRAPGLAFVSNVTGAWITPEEARDPRYWGRQMRGCVEFDAGVRCLLGRAPRTAVVEVGPGQTFAGLVRRAVSGAGEGEPPVVVTASLPHRRDGRGAMTSMQRALGQLWVAGVEPDWDTYFHEDARRRIPLPTYPFTRGRHWLDEPAGAPAGPGPSARPGQRKRAEIGEWFYEPSWQRRSLPAGGTVDASARWLVLADECGVGEEVAGRLRSAGASVTVVTAAGAGETGFAPEEGRDGHYRLDPSAPDGYHLLATTLRERFGAFPQRVVHCWGVTDSREPGAGDEAAAQRLGFESLIRLTQAVDRSGAAVPGRIWVLSNGVHNVTGEETLTPAKATVLGPCRVLPREVPGTSCCAVDLDVVTRPAPGQVDRVMAELARATLPEIETVSHRGPHRWVLEYLPQRLSSQEDVRPLLRPDGFYLVTGGTGGLGLEVAAHLTERGARVLLTSRTRLPEPEEWDACLAAGQVDDRTAGIVRRLLRLRESGAEFLVVPADVSDHGQMAGALDAATRRWGAIHGVFHTAGVPGGGLIQLKDLDRAADVMRPKVRGTLVLEDVLAGRDLDFMVLFGANSANVGHFGQVDYCAANCFLDAFAQDRGRHRRVIAVDWGTWKDVGMAVTTVASAGMRQTSTDDIEQRGMSNDEGLRALGRIMTSASTSQVIVSPVDLTEVFENVFRLSDTATAAASAHGAGPDDGPRGIATAPSPGASTGDPHGPSGPTELVVCGVWQELLGIDRIDPTESFFDLGGNSLVAIQVVSAINERLGVSLTLADLYEGLTARRLADLVERPQSEPPASSLRPVDERREQMRKRRQSQQKRRTARGQ